VVQLNCLYIFGEFLGEIMLDKRNRTRRWIAKD